MRPFLNLLQDRLALYGLSFLCVFLGIYNSLASVGLGLLGLGVLLYAIGSYRSVFKRELVAPALFWIACLFSTVLSPIPRESLPGLKKLIWFLFIVPGVACAFTTKDRLKFIALLVCGIISLFSIDAAFQSIAGEDIFSARQVMRYATSPLVRLTGPFLQSALFGLFLAVAIPLLESWRRSSTGHAPIRRGLALLIVAALAVLAGTLTLGAWIGVLIGWIAMNAVDRRGSWLPVVFLTIPIALALIPNPYLAGAQETLFTNLASRFRMWEIAAGLWRERPFLGWGLNTFGHLYQNAASAGDPFFGMGTPHAHNLFVHLLVETGLLGLTAFLVMLAATGKAILRSLRRGEGTVLFLGLWGGLIAYLVHGLFESNLQTSQGHLLFWLLIGFSFLKLPLQKG